MYGIYTKRSHSVLVLVFRDWVYKTSWLSSNSLLNLEPSLRDLPPLDPCITSERHHLSISIPMLSHPHPKQIYLLVHPHFRKNRNLI